MNSAPHNRWRHAKVTDRRTCLDVARCMGRQVIVHDANPLGVGIVLVDEVAHSD